MSSRNAETPVTLQIFVGAQLQSTVEIPKDADLVLQELQVEEPIPADVFYRVRESTSGRYLNDWEALATIDFTGGGMVCPPPLFRRGTSVTFEFQNRGDKTVDVSLKLKGLYLVQSALR